MNLTKEKVFLLFPLLRFVYLIDRMTLYKYTDIHIHTLTRTVCHIPVLTGKGHAGPEEDVGLVPRTVCLWCLLPKWGRIDAAPSGI